MSINKNQLSITVKELKALLLKMGKNGRRGGTLSININVTNSRFTIWVIDGKELA